MLASWIKVLCAAAESSNTDSSVTLQSSHQFNAIIAQLHCILEATCAAQCRLWALINGSNDDDDGDDDEDYSDDNGDNDDNDGDNDDYDDDDDKDGDDGDDDNDDDDDRDPVDDEHKSVIMFRRRDAAGPSLPSKILPPSIFIALQVIAGLVKCLFLF